jgi:hypothetical protein
VDLVKRLIYSRIPYTGTDVVEADNRGIKGDEGMVEVVVDWIEQ